MISQEINKDGGIMMSKKMIPCKSCGQEIVSSAKICPHCGVKNKKPFYKKVWFWLVVAVVMIAIISGGGENNDDPVQVGTVGQSTNVEQSNAAENEKETEQPTQEAKTAYSVGDILMDGDMKIVYVASGEYKEENEFSQPKDGYKYIFLRFAFENTSDSSDQTISEFSFEGYADGYAVDMYYGGEEQLSATLSAGRVTTGSVYFTVPEASQDIQVEYTTNYFTSDKIVFTYSGEIDSGYVPEGVLSATPGAYPVGAVVESSNLNITYISCEEYNSDNMFVQPKDGYKFVSCEFEFENVGESDEFISSYDFDCYADGFNCDSTFIRDDNLSATLSAGRKVKGTVTFEIPVDATVVEVEYLSNYWTSNRVVFTVE